MSRELGLFPLPLVLVPTERIPLHVFEQRYKELVEECLRDDAEFGLVLEQEDGLAATGTRAAVTELLERLPDGRLNVVVEGRERFRIVELTRGRSFRTAVVEPVEDEDDEPGPDEVEEALEVFRRLVRLTGSEVDEPSAGSPALAFELAARVSFGNELKQELLELSSPRERTLRVSELLGLAADALELEAAVRQRAGGNGKVTPPEPGST